MLFFFNKNIILYIILLPLMTMLSLLFVQKDYLVKNISIMTTSLTFLLSIYLWTLFDNLKFDFQFFLKIFWLDSYNINITLGVDGISLFFIILTTFLIPLCMLTSYNIITKKVKEYYLFFLLIEVLLLIIFSILDLFLFYVFFESILIPMFLLIGIWGSRERKVRASYFFFIYTLGGSLLMLLAIITIYNLYGTTDYIFLSYQEIPTFLQKIFWLAFFASFAIKVPMIPFHIWLPEAHVEAPTSGSIILAGILLKIGSYGFLRFSIPLFPTATLYFEPLISTLAIIAIIYSAIIAFRQTDMKRIIAYASIGHMNLIILGIFSLTISGIEGAILQMISHGIVSSALFLSVGVLYDRYHSRSLNYYNGLVQTMPIFSIFLALYLLANISLPGTSSFTGELLILLGLYEKNIMTTFLASTGIFLSVFYSFWMYNRISFGNPKGNFLKYFYDLTTIELFINIPLSLSILIIGLYPNLFLEPLHLSVINLISKVSFINC